MPANRGEDRPVQSKIIDWITSQAYNNVMLSAILAAIAYGSYWTVSIAIPMHLRAIQSGYEFQEASHRAEREKEDAAHRREREEMLKTYDKWVDRLSAASDSLKKKDE